LIVAGNVVAEIHDLDPFFLQISFHLIFQGGSRVIGSDSNF
jgi:hypothetical protein